MTLLWVAFRDEYPKQDFTMVNTIKNLVFYHEKIGRVRHFSQIPKNPSPKQEDKKLLVWCEISAERVFGNMSFKIL